MRRWGIASRGQPTARTVAQDPASAFHPTRRYDLPMASPALHPIIATTVPAVIDPLAAAAETHDIGLGDSRLRSSGRPDGSAPTASRTSWRTTVRDVVITGIPGPW